MWPRGFIQYPERMEPVEVPAAPPSVEFFQGYNVIEIQKRTIDLFQNLNIFALHQWEVPLFELTSQNIDFILNRNLSQSENINVFALPQWEVPFVTYDNYVKQFKQKILQQPNQQHIFEVSPAPPSINLEWYNRLEPIFIRKQSQHQYEFAGNYIPFIPPVPESSWKPLFPDIVYSRAIPITVIPYHDFRDVGNFTNPPIPFDPNARLVAIVNIAEGWDTHFSSRSWASIQAQVDAGYPLYCQPTLTSGYYEEIIDFGAVFNSVIIGLSFNTELVAGTVSCQPQLAFSTDGVSYSAYENTTQLFATSVRYVKFKLNFSAPTDLDVAYFRNVQVTLSVRRETDQGRVDCLASDSGGTLVNFNKTFKDVESITATPQTTSTYYTVIDFTDVPNPTSFRILVYNLSGVRVDATVDWIARGIT